MARRYEEKGLEGLRDKSSRPHYCSHATSAEVVGKIMYLPQNYHFGPEKISMYLKRYHEIDLSTPGGVADPETSRVELASDDPREATCAHSVPRWAIRRASSRSTGPPDRRRRARRTLPKSSQPMRGRASLVRNGPPRGGAGSIGSLIV